MAPVKVLIAGCGCRGSGYATYAANFPDKMQVIGVADPREFYRNDLAKKHNLPSGAIYPDWQRMIAQPKQADAVIIATQDAGHTEPAVAFAQAGYHILLEKPMAPTPADCRRIVDAVIKADVIFGVCHVMRYTRYTTMLKELLDAGRIGNIVSIEHLEPVGYWHQAHSYVRGNWRNEALSSSMLLAKSCHDLDWLRHVIGKPCRKISSFGSLRHFRRENRPADAGDRCVTCPAHVESACPYSAKRFYLSKLTEHQEAGIFGWPVSVLTPEPTAEAVTAALETGPYGRCVYACDNDVVDHQVVAMEFDDQVTANFTMTAFDFSGGRKTRIFGDRGMITTDSSTIKILDFLTDTTETIDTAATDAGILGGHGGGDFGVMSAFISACATGDRSKILSGPTESLETHLMVFTAEQARRDGLGITVNH